MNTLLSAYGDSDSSPSPVIKNESIQEKDKKVESPGQPQEQQTTSEIVNDKKPAEENAELNNIPPSPEGECDPNLQAKIALFIQKHRDGLNLNEDLKRQKQFGNPEILDKIVQHFEIDELGSNYPKDIWDPHGLPKEDYYDKLGKVKTLQFH